MHHQHDSLVPPINDYVYVTVDLSYPACPVFSFLEVEGSWVVSSSYALEYLDPVESAVKDKFLSPFFWVRVPDKGQDWNDISMARMVFHWPRKANNYRRQPWPL